MEGLSSLEMALIIGISTLFSLFVWLLKRFIKSYDDNTRTLVAINGTMQIMDKKLDAATEVDREILMELARVKHHKTG
jgi:hypothetical protein